MLTRKLDIELSKAHELAADAKTSFSSNQGSELVNTVHIFIYIYILIYVSIYACIYIYVFLYMLGGPGIYIYRDTHLHRYMGSECADMHAVVHCVPVQSLVVYIYSLRGHACSSSKHVKACVCVPQASQTVSPVDLQAHFAHGCGDGPRHLALTWRLGSLRAMGIYRLLGLGVGLVKGQWSKMNSRRIQEISSILYIYIYTYACVYICVYVYFLYLQCVYVHPCIYMLISTCNGGV